MKKLCLSLSVCLLSMFLLCSCFNHANTKIPYLPIDKNDVLKIQINHYGTRYANEQEQQRIIECLNSINKYEKKITIPKNKGGKPTPVNIQIFSKKQKDENNYLSIVNYDNNCILIGGSLSREGYVVRQDDIKKLLE